MITPLEKIRNIKFNILEQNNTILTKGFLFGNISLGDTSNALILKGTIDYLISGKRLDDYIFAQ